MFKRSPDKQFKFCSANGFNMEHIKLLKFEEETNNERFTNDASKPSSNKPTPEISGNNKSSFKPLSVSSMIRRNLTANDDACQRCGPWRCQFQARRCQHQNQGNYRRESSPLRQAENDEEGSKTSLRLSSSEICFLSTFRESLFTRFVNFCAIMASVPSTLL